MSESKDTLYCPDKGRICPARQMCQNGIEQSSSRAERLAKWVRLQSVFLPRSFMGRPVKTPASQELRQARNTGAEFEAILDLNCTNPDSCIAQEALEARGLSDNKLLEGINGS